MQHHTEREGHYRAGEAHPRAVLSDRDVEDIRRLYETTPLSVRALAEDYGVTVSCIKKLVYYQRRCAPRRLNAP